MSGTQKKSAASAVGYSGKPLSQKLGLKAGQRVRLINAPADYWAFCNFDPADILLRARNNELFDFGHIFATMRADLERELPALMASMDVKSMLWVSWPKKSSGVATDLTFDLVQRTGLDAGLVDNKSCAIDDTWQAVRFVIRLRDR